MAEQGITLFESGVTVQPRGLTLYGLSYEKWEAGYRKFIGVEECGPFWIGDYLLWGEATFGEQFSQALDEAHEKTHMTYRYVCSRISPERRREALSFSIHREICSIDDIATQDKVLDVAERDGCTVREVRRLCKAARGEMKPAVDWWAKFEKLLNDIEDNLEDTEYYKLVQKMMDELAMRGVKVVHEPHES